MAGIIVLSMTARAGIHRFGPLSALRAHAKAPSKTDLHKKTLRALERPGGPGQCFITAISLTAGSVEFSGQRPAWPRAVKSLSGDIHSNVLENSCNRMCI
jgi:hypothetical protein